MEVMWYYKKAVTQKDSGWTLKIEQRERTEIKTLINSF